MILANKASLQPQVFVGRATVEGHARKRRLKLSSPLLLGLVACAILSLALVYVGQRTYLMTLSYQLDAVERQLSTAWREHDFLELQIARAHSLGRVEQVATSKLGMVRPASRQFVVLEPNQVDPYRPIHEAPLQERGLFALAVDWVSRHWPRMDTAEAGGEGR